MVLEGETRAFIISLSIGSIVSLLSSRWFQLLREYQADSQKEGNNYDTAIGSELWILLGRIIAAHERPIVYNVSTAS
jgi:hypothetical protein